MAPSRNGLQGRFLALLGSLLLLATLTTAVAIPREDQSPALDERSLFNIALPILPCFRPTVRKEWSKLTSTEKKAYTSAVKCLAAKPAKLKSVFPAVRHRYDDFTAVHNSQTPNIHFVGHFLPWHRYYLWAYEKALREECGYKGTQPYWDWSKDAASGKAMNDFDIFSPVDGFGGNGPFVPTTPEQNWIGLNDRSGGGCVTNGPFATDFTINVGPGTDLTTAKPHCLIRDFCPDTFRKNVAQDVVDEVTKHKTYTDFAWRLEGLPGWSMTNFHGGGHFGVGGLLGSMGDSYNSPNDPVFYLHHANVDRIWTKWQEENLIPRILDMGGPIKAFDYSGQNVTLSFKIGLNELASEIPIAAVMYTRGPMLCYKYD